MCERFAPDAAHGFGLTANGNQRRRFRDKFSLMEAPEVHILRYSSRGSCLGHSQDDVMSMARGHGDG